MTALFVLHSWKQGLVSSFCVQRKYLWPYFWYQDLQVQTYVIPESCIIFSTWETRHLVLSLCPEEERGEYSSPFSWKPLFSQRRAHLGCLFQVYLWKKWEQEPGILVSSWNVAKNEGNSPIAVGAAPLGRSSSSTAVNLWVLNMGWNWRVVRMKPSCTAYVNILITPVHVSVFPIKWHRKT